MKHVGEVEYELPGPLEPQDVHGEPGKASRFGACQRAAELLRIADDFIDLLRTAVPDGGGRHPARRREFSEAAFPLLGALADVLQPLMPELEIDVSPGMVRAQWMAEDDGE